jgi:hypothetical protein
VQTWTDWPLERLDYLFLAIAYLAVWAQLTLFHWKGGFHTITMWAPVAYTPVLVIVLLAASFLNGLGLVLVGALAIGVVEGLIGTVLHLRGVVKRVGGFSLANLLAGPPFILPIIYAALGIFGLLVYYLPSLGGVR